MADMKPLADLFWVPVVKQVKQVKKEKPKITESQLADMKADYLASIQFKRFDDTADIIREAMRLGVAL